MERSHYVNLTRTCKLDPHHAVDHGISPRLSPFAKERAMPQLSTATV